MKSKVGGEDMQGCLEINQCMREWWHKLIENDNVPSQNP